MERAMKLRWGRKWSGSQLQLTTTGETRTVEKFKRIGVDSNAVHMEGLAIRKRILGSENPEVPHPVIYR